MSQVIYRRNHLSGGSGGGGGFVYPYTVDNSCLFVSGDSTTLSRTPGSSGNRRTFTISVWIKRSDVVPTGNNSEYFFYSAQDSENFTGIEFQDNNTLRLLHRVASANILDVITTPVYRDPSQWLNVVVAVDTTQADADNRFKIYINGVQVTSFGTNTRPAQNTDTFVNHTVGHTIGVRATSYYFDGYLSEYVIIDGQALGPDSFGQDVSGIWCPSDVSGLIFGTNGFYLDFADAADLGDDESGNTNDWTENNITAANQSSDTPTNNYCVLNPLIPSASTSEGNLTTTVAETHGIFAVSCGTWAWKFTATGNGNIGVEESDGTETQFAVTSGSVYEVFLDCDAGTLKYKEDGGSLTSAASGLSGRFVPQFEAAGSVEFDHTSTESGYVAMCSANLQDGAGTDPTVAEVVGVEGFVSATDTYDAIVSTIEAARSGWSAWIDVFKRTDNTSNWRVRFSDDSSNQLSFNLQDDKTSFVNPSSDAGTWLGWSWRVGAAYGCVTGTISHTNGAGDSTGAHGLGATPEFCITKPENQNSTDWYSYHSGLTANYNILLNSLAVQTSTEYVEVDATNITIKSAAPTGTYRYIAFVGIEGFSYFGTYEGNGAADGTFVNCGFLPSLITGKNIDSAANWLFLSDTLSPSNEVADYLIPDTTDAAGSGSRGDFVSNGLKLRTTNITANTAESFIVAAWAAQPFKYANAR